MQVETVRVKCEIVEGNDQGFYIVNKEDVTDDMVLFDAPEKPKAEEPKSPTWAKA